MLSVSQRRRPPVSLFAPRNLSASNLSFFDTQSQHSPSPSSAADSVAKLAPHYFAPAPAAQPAAASFDSTSPFCDPSQYMSEGLYYQQHPAIRLQQSTPVPHLPATISHNADLATGAHAGDWNGFDNADGQLSTSAALPAAGYHRSSASHQRAASSSSIASSASGSSYGYNQPAYALGQAGCSPPLSADKFDSSYPAADRVFSNNLPTPTHTPTQDSFNPRGYPQFTSQSSLPSQMALKQDMLDSNLGVDDELPGFSHSARHSVSSFANSPSTPHTIHEDIDDRYKVPGNDLMRQSVDLFPSSNLTSPQARMQRGQHGLLSPYSKNQHLVAELMHEANKNRSQSPTTMSARPVSPFRQSSPFVAAQMRQQQKLEADAFAASGQALSKPDDSSAPKTISPKDVQLEYNEADDSSKMPLFPDEGEYSQSTFNRTDRYGSTPQNAFDNSPSSFSGMGTPRSQAWLPTQQAAAALPHASFSFTPSSGAGNVPSLSFPSQQFRAAGSLAGHEPTPDFPAHLTSMESSASEAGMDMPPSSTATSLGEVKRPESTTADAGTYSCTSPGCFQRFDSPHRLQKHKREAHRQHAPAQRPASPAIGSNMSSAELLARNSQTGPHKCERVNPTTGKPCNTVFSRPYDLTRHEDTIHNGRKQKVRCALCVEEKTFSRNDALTRHMRVVHPEVDFPGKHRRRGAHE